MDETKYLPAFQIITNAGNSKSASLMAIEAARKYDFVTAEEYLKEASAEMLLAHQAQTELIQEEAKGNPADVNIILIHAQDHLTMAVMAKDNAEEFVSLYRLIEKIEKKEGKIL